MVVVKLQFVNQTDVCFKIENRRDSSAWMRGRQDRACPWGHGAGDRCVCARQTTILELHPPQADGAGDIAEGIAVGVLVVPVALYALGYALGASVVTEKTFEDAFDDVCATGDTAIGKVKKAAQDVAEKGVQGSLTLRPASRASEGGAGGGSSGADAAPEPEPESSLEDQSRNRINRVHELEVQLDQVVSAVEKKMAVSTGLDKAVDAGVDMFGAVEAGVALAEQLRGELARLRGEEWAPYAVLSPEDIALAEEKRRGEVWPSLSELQQQAATSHADGMMADTARKQESRPCRHRNALMRCTCDTTSRGSPSLAVNLTGSVCLARAR